MPMHYENSKTILIPYVTCPGHISRRGSGEFHINLLNLYWVVVVKIWSRWRWWHVSKQLTTFFEISIKSLNPSRIFHHIRPFWGHPPSWSPFRPRAPSRNSKGFIIPEPSTISFQFRNRGSQQQPIEIFACLYAAPSFSRWKRITPILKQAVIHTINFLTCNPD